MKKLVYFVLVLLLLMILTVLYQYKLGAITFLVLSILFFILAYKGFSGERKKGKNNG